MRFLGPGLRIEPLDHFAGHFDAAESSTASRRRCAGRCTPHELRRSGGAVACARAQGDDRTAHVAYGGAQGFYGHDSREMLVRADATRALPFCAPGSLGHGLEYRGNDAQPGRAGAPRWTGDRSQVSVWRAWHSPSASATRDCVGVSCPRVTSLHGLGASAQGEDRRLGLRRPARERSVSIGPSAHRRLPDGSTSTDSVRTRMDVTRLWRLLRRT